MGMKFNPFTGTFDFTGSGGAATTPGGSDTQVQFNDAGAFGGDAELTYNKTTNVFTLGGTIKISGGVPGAGKVLTSDADGDGSWEDASQIGLHYPSLFVAASNASARDIAGADYLCDGTDDQVQISAAIAALTNGGKVVLSEGTFSINADTVFANKICLEGQGDGTILRIANSSQANGIEVSGVSDVIVRNLQVDGNKAGVDTGGTLYTTINGIRVFDSERVTIQNCTCHDAYFGGIAVDTSVDIKVLDNTCYDNRDNQIFLRPSNVGVLIEGNIVYGSSFNGIQSLRSDYVDVIGNIAYDNGPTSAEGDGIGFEGCRYSRIEGNIIHSNGIQGVKVDYTVEGGPPDQRSLSCVIANNTIYDHTDTGNGCGIEVLRSDDTTIQGNRIKDAKYGINVGEVIGIKIQDNIVTDTDSQGIRIHDTAATGVVIDGNTVTTTGSHGIEVFQDRVRITNNIVSASADQGIRISNGDNDYIARNTIFDNTNNGILISGDAAGITEVRDNNFYNTGSTQDRALYEEAGSGSTRMVNNRITGMGTAEFEFNRTGSIYISETVFNESGADVDYRAEGDTATSLLVLDAGLDAVQIGTTTAGAIADFRSAAIVFNEDGADRDIRMEGDTVTNAFYLDASTNRIGLGVSAPTETLHVSGNFQVGVAETHGKAYRFRVTGAGLDLDAAGILYIGTNSQTDFAGTQRYYITLHNGSHTSQMSGTYNFENGNTPWSTTTHARISPAAYFFNEQGADIDFRIEGDTDANLVFVDASTDRVGIGTASPAEKLDVVGSIALSGNVVLAENAAILMDPAMSADGKYNGIIRAGTAGATLAFGDLVYLDPTDSRWELADANAAAGADGDARGVLGICVLAAASDGSATTILLQGIVRADTAFPSMTINNPQYVSETAGDITGTQPTTTDVVIRVVGVALTADELYFNPSYDYITHT